VEKGGGILPCKGVKIIWGGGFVCRVFPQDGEEKGHGRKTGKIPERCEGCGILRNYYSRVLAKFKEGEGCVGKGGGCYFYIEGGFFPSAERKKNEFRCRGEVKRKKKGVYWRGQLVKKIRLVLGALQLGKKGMDKCGE